MAHLETNIIAYKVISSIPLGDRWIGKPKILPTPMESTPSPSCLPIGVINNFRGISITFPHYSPSHFWDQNLSNTPRIDGKRLHGCVHPSSGLVNGSGGLSYMCVSFFQVLGPNLMRRGSSKIFSKPIAVPGSPFVLGIGIGVFFAFASMGAH